MNKAKILVFIILCSSNYTKTYIQENCYLTIETHNDGFGSQYQSLLNTIAIANYLGIKFAFTPMHNIAHNYDNNTDFIERLNTFTGIANKYVNVKNIPTSVKRKKVSSLDQIKPNNNCLYTIDHVVSKTIIDSNVAILNKFKNSLYKMYMSSPKPTLDSLKKNKVNVAVHVRRKNIVDDRESLLENNYYFKVMNLILQSYPEAIFHIYSQASHEVCNYNSDIPHGFNGYEKYNTVFHLDESIEKTFHGMVMADILVTCDSSLSYAAAFLSKGEIYYHEFWHKPLPGWIVIKS